MIYLSGLLSKRLLLCVLPCPLFCLSLELQTEQAVFARLLSPSSDWLTALWVARYQAYHWSHSGAFTLVNTAESAASVMLNSAWQMLHTTLFWQLFRHFASLIETFRPTIPQLSPSSTRSLLVDWLQARGGFVSGKTPEVNKVALTALKYFIALISATLIS